MVKSIFDPVAAARDDRSSAGGRSRALRLSSLLLITVALLILSLIIIG